MEGNMNIAKVNLRILAIAGLTLMILALVFGVCETLYFGNNWFPSSKAELFCDFLAATMCGAGISLFMSAIIIKVKSSACKKENT